MKVITLPKLQPWQEEVYKDVATARRSSRTYVVKSKRQVGKSILAICLLIKYGLEEKCISVCVEPTQAQCRRVFKQLCDFLQGADVITSANSTLLTITFVNGSEILFKSAEQGDALRGFSVSGGLLVIDEAAFIQKSIFEILYSTTDAAKSPTLIISTPLFADDRNEFYNLYMRGMSGSDFVKSYDWSKYDTSIFLSPEKLEYYRQTISPLKFKSEYLGEFITEGSYIFGTINTSEYSTLPPKYCGIDWGTGDGNDYTCVVLMDDNGCVTDIWAKKDLDAVEQVDKIADIINSHPSLEVILVEKNSIGQVFYDNLKRKVRKPIERFTTTNDSKRKIIEQLVEAFQTNNIGIPYDEELIRELQHYNIEKTKTGYTYNGSDGINDDYCIALALAYNCYKRHLGKFSIAFV